MYAEMTRLVSVLDAGQGTGVIHWSCPVPFFGHIEKALIATVGINPSNREFVGMSGAELDAESRRLPTLSSLGLSHWGDADYVAVRHVLAACRDYFERNPYDGWFGALEQLIAGTGCSYYPPTSNACHLDIVPWATAHKWGVLPPRVRRSLVDRAAGALASLIDRSPVQLLILNGQEVVRRFEALAHVELATAEMPCWSLPRRSGKNVAGIAYTASINCVGHAPLGRQIRVIGYNHNLQSSFGVTASVRDSIRRWITAEYSRLTL